MSECSHVAVTAYINPDYPDHPMWACDECRIRFYPHDAAERSAAAERMRLRAERVEAALQDCYQLAVEVYAHADRNGMHLGEGHDDPTVRIWVHKSTVDRMGDTLARVAEALRAPEGEPE